MSEWLSLEAVKMMGSMKSLLVFDTSETMEAAMASNRLLEHFLEVRAWSEGDTNKTRNVWLEVTGLPIHGWSQENMRAIGNVWGRVIQIGKDEGHFSSFRVLVVANTGPEIRAMATIVIEDTKFLIFVKEEGSSCCDREDQRAENPTDDGEKVTIDVPAINEKIVDDGRPQTNNEANVNNLVSTVRPANREAVPESPSVTSRNKVVEESKDEGSKVRETQQSPIVRDEGSSLWASDVGHKDSQCPNSPTRTVSLEDDRRTDQVIREWNETIFQKPGETFGPLDETSTRNEEDRVIGPDKGEGVQQSSESEPTSLSVPPGFENVLLPQKVLSTAENANEPERSRRRKLRSKSSTGKRTSIRLRDIIKEKARKQKESSRKKKATIEEIREEEKLGLWQSSNDEIEDTSDEIEGTWWVGAKTGICEEYENRAKEYLRSEARGRSEEGNNRKEKGKRRREERQKEVGVSESLNK
ncbi:hypothetical protein PIB30_015504 [Stylosanthes scabra]|uniref:DUF4283 domain-containing protein n=1 Tax=Stylosanthes scabra TaxID=79078 RepID=A0ABU6X5E8_9FABA|nr:hypothetical protein [Stylosanthes scabra]